MSSTFDEMNEKIIKTASNTVKDGDVATLRDTSGVWKENHTDQAAKNALSEAVGERFQTALEEVVKETKAGLQDTSGVWKENHTADSARTAVSKTLGETAKNASNTVKDGDVATLRDTSEVWRENHTADSARTAVSKTLGETAREALEEVVKETKAGLQDTSEVWKNNDIANEANDKMGNIEGTVSGDGNNSGSAYSLGERAGRLDGAPTIAANNITHLRMSSTQEVPTEQPYQLSNESSPPKGTVVDANGQILDENGKVIGVQKLEYNSNGEVRSVSRTMYEFDDKGRIKSETTRIESKNYGNGPEYVETSKKYLDKEGYTVVETDINDTSNFAYTAHIVEKDNGDGTKTVTSDYNKYDVPKGITTETVPSDITQLESTAEDNIYVREFNKSSKVTTEIRNGSVVGKTSTTTIKNEDGTETYVIDTNENGKMTRTIKYPDGREETAKYDDITGKYIVTTSDENGNTEAHYDDSLDLGVRNYSTLENEIPQKETIDIFQVDDVAKIVTGDKDKTMSQLGDDLLNEYLLDPTSAEGKNIYNYLKETNWEDQANKMYDDALDVYSSIALLKEQFGVDGEIALGGEIGEILAKNLGLCEEDAIELTNYIVENVKPAAHEIERMKDLIAQRDEAMDEYNKLVKEKEALESELSALEAQNIQPPTWEKIEVDGVLTDHWVDNPAYKPWVDDCNELRNIKIPAKEDEINNILLELREIKAELLNTYKRILEFNSAVLKFRSSWNPV